MIDDLPAAFERHADEYIKFERIASPRHPRPDICAFLLLHELAPGRGDMVRSSEHDEIWLNVDCNRLAAAASDEHIIELARCGVRYCGRTDLLCMFV